MTVEDRLAALERAVRRARWLNLGLGTLLLLAWAGLAWIFVGTPRVLRAQRFEIVNSKGAAVELATSPDGDGFIGITDSKGAARIRMGVSRKNIGMIETYTAHDQKVVAVGGSGAGGQVAIFNNVGHRVVDIQSSKTNCGAIVVNDYDGSFHSGLTGDRRL